MSLTTLKIGAISCLTVGTILGVFSAFIPGIEESNLEKTAKTESALTSANQAKWESVPGQYDYNVQWDHYLWANANYVRTLYNNEAPTFTQAGPYVYQEQDAYSNIAYSQNGEQVSATLNQNTVHVSDPGDIDTVMWLPNQGAINNWWRMNNQSPWQTYMQVLYDMVNHWQGEFLQKESVYKAMRTNYFVLSSGINNYLLLNNPISDPVLLDAIYTDPWYGLENSENYDKWQVLQSGNANTTAVNEKLVFQAELRTYFGLSSAQVQEITNNWNGLFGAQLDLFNINLPSPAEYQNTFGVGYWQWATGQITNDLAGVATMANFGNNEFVGYYDIPYFKSNYFNAVAIPQNQNIFSSVNLYDSYYSTVKSNYENLFATFDTTVGVGTEPPESSLFNLSNMELLVDLGMNTPNILTDNAQIYNTTFTLDSEWITLTQTLGLATQEQTYLLWLWLDTAFDVTWDRIQDGGDDQTGMIGKLAADSLHDSITTMRLELPMFIYASQFNVSYSANVTNNGLDCEGFYMNVLQWPSGVSSNLCNDTSNTFNFVYNPNNFQGYIKTAVALTSIFLYGNKFDTANAGYYSTFQALTGWNVIQISQQTTNPNSLVSDFMNNQLKAPVYLHYQTVDGDICDSAIVAGCAFTNLTYNQWLHGSALYYPLGDIDIEPINSSYQIFYSDYTTLKFPPEAFYYAAMSSWDYPAEVTVFDLYESFSQTGLYSATIQKNIWLNSQNLGTTNVFSSPNTKFYQRYTSLNFGLGGFFTPLTPRQVIEGYYSPELEAVSTTPVYLGGDITVTPWISADNMTPTKPGNAMITFMTGTNDSSKTRQVASWLQNSNVKVQQKEFDTTITAYADYFDPWAVEVPIVGTDGWQFSPDLDDDAPIQVFSSDLSRPLSYMYTGESDSQFNGYEVLTFNLNPSNFEISGENFYFTDLAGTTNMTYTYYAPVFITTGNFWQIQSSATPSVPTDINGNIFPTDPAACQSYLVIDKVSGTTMQMQSSFQTNFQVFQDSIFMFNQTSTFGQFVPNVWINKNFKLSTSTIQSLLGYQGSIKTTEWVLFGVCLGVGIVLLGVGVMLLLKFMKAKKIAEMTSDNINSSSRS